MTTMTDDLRLAEDVQALSDAVGELIRVIQFRDRDRACCYDLSVTQCYALKGIAGAGAMTVNELAAHMYLDKSTVSRVARGLEDKGMITREKDPEDGRIVVLIATDEGVRTLKKIEDEISVEYAELLEDFDPALRPAMLNLLRRLARSFAARVEVSAGNCCVVPRT